MNLEVGTDLWRLSAADLLGGDAHGEVSPIEVVDKALLWAQHWAARAMEIGP